jgi:hypothetical protein
MIFNTFVYAVLQPIITEVYIKVHMATHLVNTKQTGLKADEALRVQLNKETRALYQT